MSDIKLNELSGDINITNGQVLIIEDSVEALQQRLIVRLRTFAEEWFLNKNAGLPYFQHIYTQRVDLDAIDSIFRNYILKTSGVSRITFFESSIDRSNRLYTLSFEVLTDNNETLNIIEFEV